MQLRGRSKERRGSRKFTPPGPAYMSDEQLAQYLADLRENHVPRPSGARPFPSSATTAAPSIADRGDISVFAGNDYAPSISSHRRAQSNVSVSSRASRQLVQQPHPGVTARDFSKEQPLKPLNPSVVVPSATYIERGQRWMEKEEAVALRDALEDMDIKDHEEEQRIHAAAQEEASELVWQHQHPESTRPDGPYKYREHLRKNSYAHARTQSVGAYTTETPVTGLARDYRSISGSSTYSATIFSQRSRVSSGSSGVSMGQSEARPSLDNNRELPNFSRPQKSYGILNSNAQNNRRRSSGKRNISGEPLRSFSGDQIWEEPEEEPSRSLPQNGSDMPAPLRITPRNPLSRVPFNQGSAPQADGSPEPPKKYPRYDINHSSPTQSRNAGYTVNPPPSAAKTSQQRASANSEELEVRGDDIRQATSMKLKDRSPKLPTPTFVSDKPGRPIVSFDAHWKPQEADRKSVETHRWGGSEQAKTNASLSRSKELPSLPTPQTVPQTSIPSIRLPRSSDVQLSHKPVPIPPRAADAIPDIPKINISNVPTICLPDEPPAKTPSVPSIQISSIPTINTPDIPTINIPDVPTVTVSEPSATTSNSDSKRPLPDPKNGRARPFPRQHARPPNFSKGHWSPAVGSRATATCHQCCQPIEGRVVALQGIKERFHPECFTCYICGTGLEALEISPEPEANRLERLDRIQRRAQGEELEEIEGQTMAEDGDDRLRFYCHLDWHELFAPRCKHCKTPIIGEHTVALGEHWHDGHFFCAECGDPFSPGQTHIEKDGYAWCLKCQTKRTERQAPKCRKCRGPVIGQYVEALGGEYHDECFRCVTCGQGFDDGQIFPKIDASGDTVVVCTACMARELKA